MALLRRRTKVDIPHVPFTGAAPLLNNGFGADLSLGIQLGF